MATHCKRNHELTPENTYVSRHGYRSCKACRILAVKRCLLRKEIRNLILEIRIKQSFEDVSELIARKYDAELKLEAMI